MKNEYAVYIGRFQPFHLGHVHVIKEALERAEHLIICIGSSNESRTAKNPFTFQERCGTILAWAQSEGVLNSITLIALEDKETDIEWKSAVTSEVQSVTDSSANVSIIGHYKDDSSWYLEAFPQYAVILVTSYDNINASCIREEYFLSGNPTYALKPLLPTSTKDFLINFKVFNTKEFRDLCNSSKLVALGSPKLVTTEYPRIDHTADCIVLGTYEGCSIPYILLIKRKNDPGKGEWALPGGFVEVGETILESAYRELEEETGIKCADLLMEDSPTGYVFDTPKRDPRGRIITTAYVLECAGYIDYLNYVAKDDASDINWFPLSDNTLSNIPMFLDHNIIITDCLEVENIYTIA